MGPGLELYHHAKVNYNHIFGVYCLYIFFKKIFNNSEAIEREISEININVMIYIIYLILD